MIVALAVTTPQTDASRKRGEVFATITPDLDKIQRTVGDGLAPRPAARNLGEKQRDMLMADRRSKTLLADDRYIVGWTRCIKHYPATLPTSLAFPGVAVRVWLAEDLDRARRFPATRQADGQVTMTGADLASWAVPASGETWAQAAARLWADPATILAAPLVPVRLDGNQIGDDGMRTALRVIATMSPHAPIPVTF